MRCLTVTIVWFMCTNMRADTVTLDRAAIESACRAALLTRSGLAGKARVNRKTLWAALRGRPVSGKTAKRIASALHVSVRTLLVDKCRGSTAAAGSCGQLVTEILRDGNDNSA